MKKIFFLLLLLAASSLVFFSYQRQKSQSAADASQALSQVEPKQAERARDLFKKAISKNSSVIKSEAFAEQKSKIPSECKENWTYLSESNLDQIEFDFDQGRALIDESCLQHEEAVLPHSFKELKSCLFAPKSKTRSEKERASCLSALLFYRARIIDELTKGENDYRKLDSSVLMNKILAQFSKGQFGENTLDDLQAMTQALAEKEPNLYAAQKAAASVLLVKGFTDKEEFKNEEEFNAALEKAQALNAEDGELFEASLAPDLAKKDLQSIAEKITNYEKHAPDSPIPDYYRSYLAWENNKREESLEWMKSAISRDPTNQRFKRTLKQMRQSKTGQPGVFGLDLNFNFADL